jgi:hypothetical protein
MTDSCHPSHVTRASDASTFDEVCTNCGATDIAGGGWGKLAEPCVLASRHNDSTGECESVDVEPTKVAQLREKISNRPTVTMSAVKVLAIRDALIAEDYEEAYHQLYGAVDPTFTKLEPWAELERIRDEIRRT